MNRTESLDFRLKEFLAGWPPPLAREFAHYREGLRRGASTHAAWGQPLPLPYWMRLPDWIVGESNSQAAGEALWGGLALFYAIRIQDDLFDGQLERSILAHAPTLLLAECHRTFGQMFPRDSEFWELFRRSVNNTISGIASVAELQRDLLSSPSSLLERYGMVDEIFAVGSAAVALKTQRERLNSPLYRFIAEMGRVAQVLDDVEDMEEDLRGGKFTYPAKVLSLRTGVNEIEEFTREWRSLTKREWGEDIAATLDAALDRASEEAGELVREAIGVVEEYRTAVMRLREGGDVR